MTDIVEPTVDERGQEHHPAWGLLGASRVNSTGSILFDSDVPHRHYVIVTLSTAKRTRDLHRDWIYADEQIVEIAMSEAQWASFVSTMNVGDGVPVTIEERGRERMPKMPYQPRLAESIAEVRTASHRAMEEIDAAMEMYLAHKTAGNLRDLQAAIKNAPRNMRFAAKSLSEHAENVGARLRADVEAFAVIKARQLGIDPADLGGTLPELNTGDTD